jgi:hypothetical protein
MVWFLFLIYSVLTSKGRITSLEYDQPMSYQVPGFVGPGIVASSTFTEEEPSPLRSLTTSRHISDSTSLTVDAQLSILEQISPTSSNTFSPPPHAFSLEIPISFPRPSQGTTATMGNDTDYLLCTESTPRTQLSGVNTELAPLPSSLVRRRRPGRPSNAQISELLKKRPYSAVKVRRQMHNDSAMRSRARLNKLLEELWEIVPVQYRTFQVENGKTREVCRAQKVEDAINYFIRLQAQLLASGKES